MAIKTLSYAVRNAKCSGDGHCVGAHAATVIATKNLENSRPTVSAPTTCRVLCGRSMYVSRWRSVDICLAIYCLREFAPDTPELYGNNQGDAPQN